MSAFHSVNVDPFQAAQIIVKITENCKIRSSINLNSTVVVYILMILLTNQGCISIHKELFNLLTAI